MEMMTKTNRAWQICQIVGVRAREIINTLEVRLLYYFRCGQELMVAMLSAEASWQSIVNYRYVTVKRVHFYGNFNLDFIVRHGDPAITRREGTRAGGTWVATLAVLLWGSGGNII